VVARSCDLERVHLATDIRTLAIVLSTPPPLRRLVFLASLCLVAPLALAGCPAEPKVTATAQASSASTPEPAVAPPAQEPASASSGGSFVAPEGAVQRGTSLSFVVDEGGTRISNLVAELMETCDGESTSTTTTVGPNLTWDIVDGSFSGRLKEVQDGVSVYTTFEGHFTSATSVEGIIRQESVVAGSVCDTYKLTFTAVAA
jgi:hypothetical protein